jgi:hypothetical protein
MQFIIIIQTCNIVLFTVTTTVCTILLTLQICIIKNGSNLHEAGPFSYILLNMKFVAVAKRHEDPKEVTR